MTEPKMTFPASGNIILYGDCWPVVSAVQSLVTSILPDSQCKVITTLPSLLKQLTRDPRVLLILCLRPREHVFLFYALRQELFDHPALIISDEIFFNDKLMLRVWGDLPCMMHDELSMMVTSQQLCELLTVPPDHCPEKSRLADFLKSPTLPEGLSEVPQIFHLEEPLMDYMSLLLYREMLDRKITPFRMRMLQAIWSGYQTREELIAELDAPKSKIWNEKHRLLIQLGMDARLRNLLYGTRFCLFLQRTAFMSPAETEHLRAEAREQLTTGTENYCTKIITNEATS